MRLSFASMAPLSLRGVLSYMIATVRAESQIKCHSGRREVYARDLSRQQLLAGTLARSSATRCRPGARRARAGPTAHPGGCLPSWREAPTGKATEGGQLTAQGRGHVTDHARCGGSNTHPTNDIARQTAHFMGLASEQEVLDVDRKHRAGRSRSACA